MQVPGQVSESGAVPFPALPAGAGRAGGKQEQQCHVAQEVRGVFKYRTKEKRENGSMVRPAAPKKNKKTKPKKK